MRPGATLSLLFWKKSRQRQRRRPRPVDETGSRRWRRAPFFASARRGAPQKTAKRKRIHLVPLTAVGFIRPCRRSGFHLFRRLPACGPVSPGFCRRLPACGPVSPGFCPVCFPIKYRFPVWAGQGVLCFMGFQGVPGEKSRLCETLHRTRAQPGRNVSEADCSTGWAF